jgi:hypothetical protein
MAPVVPPNFEDFLDLSPASVRSKVVPEFYTTPPESSLGNVTMSSGHGEDYSTQGYSTQNGSRKMQQSTSNSICSEGQEAGIFNSSALGEEERRFPNFNELFRYLKQEIVSLLLCK